MPYKDPLKRAKQSKQSQQESYKRQMAELRAVPEISPIVDLERRMAARENLQAFLMSYFPEQFYMKWGDAQLQLIKDLQRVILHGGMQSVAMPRASGKTTLCHGAIMWAICYGHRRFIYFIRSDEPSAEESLRSIKLEWETNDVLCGDFPEIAEPIRHLGGSWARARLQSYNNQLTYLHWSADEAHFPVLHDYLFYHDPNSGIVIKTKGITGGIRGAQYKHPDGRILRPDLVLLDDVQSDKTAGSPANVEKMIDIIDGAVKGLAPPGELIAAIMPCTVIKPDDVSDTYLSPARKPEWHGFRCPMVTQWPPGVTDEDITDDTEQGRLWLEYSRLRVASLMDKGDISEATEYYGLNRKTMDEGFKVSWDERFNKDPKYEGNVEISAQQHAMNLRLENLFTFSAEHQNQPKKMIKGQAAVPTPEQIIQRTIDYPRGMLPSYCKFLVGMIDVQDEILWYSVTGLGLDYTGIITAYGTWPPIAHRMFTKAQTIKWKRMSYEFFKSHPDFPRDFSLRKDKMKAAPFEAKLRFGLEQLCNELFSEGLFTYENGDPAQLDLLAIDVRWGQAAETVKRFIREYGDSRVLPYEGFYVGASSKQLSEFTRKDGSIMEDQFHRGGECRWIAKPEPRGGRRVISDVNRWKTFLVNRLATPVGGPGSLVLHKAHPADHEMLALHLTKSEYPEQVTARGRTLHEWKPYPRQDNDLFDCMVGCMCLGSMSGCKLVEEFPEIRDQEAVKPRPAKKVHPATEKKQESKREAVMARRAARERGSVHPATGRRV